ncbi:MAG: trigger factor [Planctomycetales bacterium]|nr:trigger factor [Planctomycetales bacterium]
MIFDDETTAETGDEADAETESVEEPENETAVAEAPAVDNESAADDDGDMPLPEGGSLKMSLDVEITESGPCLRHVVVKVPRADIDAVHDVAVGELSDSAEVPGFRKGHVPAGLIAKRFRRELADEVKQKLLVGSLEQLAEDHDLEPINEPNLDVDMIEIPEEGDFEYEFDVEVRPEFDLPDYKGLTIDRPVQEVTDEDVDAYLQQFLLQYAHFHDHDGPAETGDTVVVDLAFTHGGETVRTIEEAMLELRSLLRFQDAELEGFDELMAGVAAGEERTGEITVAAEADNVAMRGETLGVTFSVTAVKKTHLPELDAEFLDRLGVEDEDALKDALRGTLERQAEFGQRQNTRSQVLERITESADWDLPEELVTKQTENALRREILEMQQAGFTPQEIQARENEIRQHAISTTRQAIKEHFVLDRIAEEEELEVDGSDLDTEIQLMAMQSGENPRRLRARLIKSGMIENLEAQVRERKSIEVILEHAEFNDVEGEPLVRDPVATIDQSVCHSSSDTAAETVDEPAAEDAGEESATQDEASDETGDETVKEAEADGEADEDE